MHCLCTLQCNGCATAKRSNFAYILQPQGLVLSVLASRSIPLTNHTHNAKYGSQPQTKETNQNLSYILSALKDLWQSIIHHYLVYHIRHHKHIFSGSVFDFSDGGRHLDSRNIVFLSLHFSCVFCHQRIVCVNNLCVPTN